jgi:hypothetical protein
MATLPPGTIVAVPVASAWSSKIIWMQVIGTGFSFATWAFSLLPPQYAALGPIIIQFAQGLITWYFKTYATTTITPSSAAALK